MKYTLLVLLTFISTKTVLSKTLEEVIEEQISSRNAPLKDLHKAYSRERLAHWFPDSTKISYGSNDNHTWKTWSLMTNIPIPLKSLYRDSAEAANADYNKLSAEMVKQRVLRDVVEAHLDCAIPSEMSKLLTEALSDQRVVAAISNSLYSTGSVTQSDRVASELQLRQLESQVRAQRDLTLDGCSRWFRISDEPETEETPRIEVANDIADGILQKLGLRSDLSRDVLDKKIHSLGLSKEKLWSKHIPDLEVGITKANYFDLYLSGGPPVKYTYSWTVGITLPFNFPFFDSSAYVRESAELNLEKLSSEYERSKSEKVWRQAKKDWKRNSDRLSEIEKRDLAMAEVLVQGSLAAYRTGKIDFSSLVLARRTKLDLRIEEIQLKAQRLLAKTVCLTECDQ